MEPVGFSSTPFDPSVYLSSAQAVQQPQPPKPLSKAERIEAICKVYQQLIELEERRENQPFRTEVKELWTYAHHVDGYVTTIITKHYNVVSDFDIEDYQKEQNELVKKLEELDAYQFMASLSDDLDSLEKISSLCNKWSERSQKNTEAFIHVYGELEQIKAADDKAGFEKKETSTLSS